MIKMKLCLACILMSTLFVLTCSVPVPDSKETDSSESVESSEVSSSEVPSSEVSSSEVPVTTEKVIAPESTTTEAEGLIEFIAQEIFNLGEDEEKDTEKKPESGDKESTPTKEPTVVDIIESLFSEQEVKAEKEVTDIKDAAKQNSTLPNFSNVMETFQGLFQPIREFLQKNPITQLLSGQQSTQADNQVMNQFQTQLTNIQSMFAEYTSNVLNAVIPRPQSGNTVAAKPVIVPEITNIVDTKIEETELNKDKDEDNAVNPNIE